MKFGISKLFNTFYILPTLRVWYDKSYPDENGKTQWYSLSIEFVWLSRSLDLYLIEEK